jgi:hypothetical protein
MDPSFRRPFIESYFLGNSEVAHLQSWALKVSKYSKPGLLRDDDLD